MAAVRDHGNAGRQEKQGGKFCHETSQGQKFKRAGNVKVSVAFHVRKTSPLLKLLLYLFIYFTFTSLLFIIKI